MLFGSGGFGLVNSGFGSQGSPSTPPIPPGPAPCEQTYAPAALPNELCAQALPDTVCPVVHYQ